MPGSRPGAAEPGRALIRLGAGLFAVGAVAIVVTLVGFARGEGNRPLAQNLICLLAPIGFALVVGGLVRSGRAAAREAARRLGEPR